MSLVSIFCYSDGVPKNRAHYGSGSGSILLDNLACEGTEYNLEECDHAGWGNHDCSHSEDAGVECCKYAKSLSSYLKSSLAGLYFS